MSITIKPTGATLGAIVTDVDLSRLDDATWQEVHEAFLTYGVLVFPGQFLDEEAQGRFALRFGPEADFHHHSWPASVLDRAFEAFKLKRRLYEMDKELGGFVK